jgi:hypothetical protein
VTKGEVFTSAEWANIMYYRRWHVGRAYRGRIAHVYPGPFPTVTLCGKPDNRVFTDPGWRLAQTCQLCIQRYREIVLGTTDKVICQTKGEEHEQRGHF